MSGQALAGGCGRVVQEEGDEWVRSAGERDGRGRVKRVRFVSFCALFRLPPRSTLLLLTTFFALTSSQASSRPDPRSVSRSSLRPLRVLVRGDVQPKSVRLSFHLLLHDSIFDFTNLKRVLLPPYSLHQCRQARQIRPRSTSRLTQSLGRIRSTRTTTRKDRRGSEGLRDGSLAQLGRGEEDEFGREGRCLEAVEGMGGDGMGAERRKEGVAGHRCCCWTGWTFG